ncbi:MAG: pyrroloquinoline quinone-dependent dehydrogenase [Steroidobacteraceae bacterium]
MSALLLAHLDLRMGLMSALLFSAAIPSAAIPQATADDWPAYGRDPGGARYSPLADIDRTNVKTLELTWTFHTGHLGIETGSDPRFETTPIVVDGSLYLTTPLGELIALDPETGQERWRFDPESRRKAHYGDFANRGVSTWLDSSAAAGSPCRRRIFLATIDARLFAVDGATGKACRDFGAKGLIDLRKGLRHAPAEFPAYQVTSPPLVIGDLVVTGSAIADNAWIAPASGEVRAFDARSGALRWRWDPIPQDAADPAYASWQGGSAGPTGAANVWSVMVADPERGLIFAPTSSPAPDYFGGKRPGDNRYANSVVALAAATGKVAWHFQTVHHDLWDYDNAAPPALATLVRNGKEIPAVLQATKTGMLFVLHRETGEPLVPVTERPVPASDAPGEKASPTQPFSAISLSPHGLAAGQLGHLDAADRGVCSAALEGLRNDGIFTPPSLGGTLVRPSNIGGAHWGGVAVDAARQIAVVPVNTIAAMVQLMPAEGLDEDEAEKDSDRQRLGYEYTHMQGTGYVMRRRFLRAPSGAFCTPPPWGLLVGVDLANGEKAWEVPLGSHLDGRVPGSPNLGGPIATASGLVFIGATIEPALRAFDVQTGELLWRAELPGGARATPITYRAGGKQYVVIAAGGGDGFAEGDSLVAYALP